MQGNRVPLDDYLNFYMPDGGTVTLTKNGSPTEVQLQYSLDGCKTWTDWQEVSNVRSSILQAGQTMYLRNKSATPTGFSTSGDDYYQFAFVGTVAAHGNCNSLLCKYPNMVTTLGSFSSCFRSLFHQCTSLLTAPELPATTLASYCYRNMFYGCTSLTVAPELPATTLASYCYGGMFNNCTSLTTAPSLPATTLASYCYRLMFYGCTSLTVAPELPATTLVDNCYNRMFYGCTSLTVAPELPATTLVDNCYNRMFVGCTSLNFIKTYMTDITASDCLIYWLYTASDTGDLYCDQNLTIPTGDSGIPNGWTRHDL